MKPVGTYLLDGVRLDDPAGRWLLEQATPLRPLPAARGIEVVVPGRHGVVPIPAPTFEPGGVSMSMLVTDLDSHGVAGDHPQLLDNLDRLKSLVGQRHRLLPVTMFPTDLPTSLNPVDGKVETRRNLASQPIATTGGAWSYSLGPGEAVTAAVDNTAGAGPEGRTGFARATVTTASTSAAPSGWFYQETQSIPGVVGDVRTTSMWVRFSKAVRAALSVAHKSTTMQVRTNRATNPSFETLTGGTPAFRQNLAVGGNAIVQASPGWYQSRWFGNGGAGTHTRLSAQTDGPAGITSYIRKAWTTAALSNGNSGFDNGDGPITAGQKYTVSVYLRATSAGAKTPALLKLNWRDAANAILSNVNSVNYDLPTGVWVRLSVTATAPTGAVNLKLTTDVDGGIAWAVGDTLDATGMLIENIGVLLPYFDGTTSPGTRWNAALNPDLELGITNWGTYYAPTRLWDAAEFHSGTHSLKVTRAANAQDGVYANGYSSALDNIVAGDVLRYSAWVKAEVDVPVKMAFRVDAGTGLGGTQIVGDGQWHQYTISTTVGSYPAYGLIFSFGTASALGTSFWVDDVMMERNPPTSPTNPFTGSTAPAGAERYAWIGTPGSSRSYSIDRDTTGVAWTGTVNASTSELRSLNVTSALASTPQRPVISSTRWAARGTKSLRVGTVNTGTTNDAYSTLAGLGLVAGTSYLMSATVHLEAVQLSPSSTARKFWVGGSPANLVSGTVIVAAPNAPGTYRIQQRFDLPEGYSGIQVRLYNGAVWQPGVEDSLWWDEITIEAIDPVHPAPEAGTYFDGDSSDQTWIDFAWTGTAHASTSTATSPLNVYGGDVVDVPANTWTRLDLTTTAPVPFTGMLAYASIVDVLPVGGTADATSLLVEAGSDLAPYFDGSTPPSDPYRYSWVGAANGSESVQTLFGRIAYAQLIASVQPNMVDPYTALLVWPLELPSTFWRDPAPSIINGASFAATWTTTPIELTGSSAPIVDARLLAAGPLTKVRITDAQTGVWLEWVGNIAAGKFLRIDAGLLAAYQSDTAVWTGGTDVSGGLSAGPDPFELVPHAIDRVVGFTVTREGGAGTVSVEARRAFL